jgi:hypothetical protein
LPRLASCRCGASLLPWPASHLRRCWGSLIAPAVGPREGSMRSEEASVERERCERAEASVGSERSGAERCERSERPERGEEVEHLVERDEASGADGGVPDGPAERAKRGPNRSRDSSLFSGKHKRSSYYHLV